MASSHTRFLSSQPDAYSRAFQRFLASCDQEGAILKCIQGHIMPIITNNIPVLQENGSPFRVLSVGSGEGENDLNILKALNELLSKQGEAVTPSLVNRVIEPDVTRLNAFRSNAEVYMKHSMGRSRVDFEWLPMTFQEYAKQKKEDDTMKMNLVHFIQSIYYVDEEEALVHCYEKELGTKGVIFCISEMKESVMIKFKETFPNECVALYPNKDAITVAKEKGWKYFVCPGDSNYLDITAIFDGSSSEGNELFDFMANMINVRENEEKETVEKMLRFWKKESFLSEDGKRIAEIRDRAVIILKDHSEN